MTGYRRGVARLLAVLLAVLLALPVCGLCAQAETDGMVRVKLTRLGTPSSITFRTTCDYYVSGQPSLRIGAGKTAKVAASGSGITLSVDDASAKFDGSLRLMRSRSGNQGVRFASPSLANLFCGDLLFSASSSKLTTILRIYIEDYLYGVVGYEMSPSWNLEALKAQAVAARNYALGKVQSRKSSAYDLTDTTSDQVFRGRSSSSSYANVVKAVDATKGGVLYAGTALARCYYTASNGGQTESTRNIWGGKLSYSVVKDDPYDYTSGGAVKSATLRRDAKGLKSPLENALTAGVAQAMLDAGVDVAEDSIVLDAIESVVPCNARYAEPSRVYRTLQFTVRATAKNAAGESRSGSVKVEVPAHGGLESWYGLSINSGSNETVWVDATDDAFIVRFRRNGHGVGMSQWGAQTMAAKHGMNCGDILAFYYPGTTPKHLSLTDATADSRPAQPTATPQPTKPPTYSVIAAAKAAKDAALYAGASPSAERLVSLKTGDRIDVYAVKGDWAAVCGRGRLGFMPIDDFAGYLPVGAKVSMPEGDCYAAVAAGGGAALRALPDAASTRKGTLSKDSLVRVHARIGDWAAVETPSGETGFVAVSLLKAKAVEAPTPTPSPTPTPAPQKDAVTTVKGTKYVYVSAASAPMYKSDSASAKVLGTLPYGTKLRIGAYNREWACVRANGKTGYIRREQLTERSPVSTSRTDVRTAEFYAQATRAATVYRAAELKSAKIGALKKDQRVTVYAYNNEFAYVGVGKNRGFVELRNLKIVV